MALIKKIILDNGITVNYHRIVSIINIINHETIIEVASYPSKEKREEEKQALKENKPMNVFMSPTRFSMPYTNTLDITATYDYLKTQGYFKNAKNDV